MEETQVQAAETRLISALERMEQTLGRIEAQYEALSAKVDQIVAAVEEEPTGEKTGGRKTLSASLAALLEKSGMESDPIDGDALGKALASLSVEQRIAVKAQLARAGILE